MLSHRGADKLSRQCEKYTQSGRHRSLCHFQRVLHMVSCDLDLPMESSAAVLFNDIPSAWNQNAHRTLNVSLNWMSFENHMFHIATECSCVCVVVTSCHRHGSSPVSKWRLSEKGRDSSSDTSCRCLQFKASPLTLWLNWSRLVLDHSLFLFFFVPHSRLGLDWSKIKTKLWKSSNESLVLIAGCLD